jgi:thiamine biosynthesis lipoprotein
LLLLSAKIGRLISNKKMNFSMTRLYLAGLAFIFLSSCSNDNFIYEISGPTMGTSYSIKSSKRINQKEITEELERISQIFSNWVSDSEINRFNQTRVNQSFSPSKEFQEVVEISKKINLETGGYFDPGINNLINKLGFGEKPAKKINSVDEIKKLANHSSIASIDLKNNQLVKRDEVQVNFSAIAKGYAVDLLADLLINKGHQNFLIEIGGEVFAQGKKNSDPWKIGIQSPENHQPLSIPIHDEGVATSGNYLNFTLVNQQKVGHILNPKTGTSENNHLFSVSVIHPKVAIADAYATALMAMPIDEAKHLILKEKLKVVLIVKQNKAYKVEKINFQ